VDYRNEEGQEMGEGEAPAITQHTLPPPQPQASRRRLTRREHRRRASSRHDCGYAIRSRDAPAAANLLLLYSDFFFFFILYSSTFSARVN
jgi:hypothetical protein